MIINQLEIISFGKFKNKIIDFNCGLNIICGNNESGKSTIINFIYAMLYGFGDNRGKGLSLREKYTPWDGGVCEGKLTVKTDNNERLTIYRKAGNVKKYDILQVYDSLTGKEIEITPEELVGINGDTFLKTLCVRQLSTVTDGSNDEIALKLSNIAKGGDESINYEKAIRLLDASRREIKPLRGDGGMLAKIKERITQEERSYAAYEQRSAELKNLLTLLPRIKAEAEKAQKDYENEAKKDFDLSIAHLSGRIEEREKSGNIAVNFSFKKIFLIIGIIFLIIFFTLLILNRGVSFPFLILSALSFCTSLVKRSEGSNGFKNAENELSNQLEKLKKEKAIHDKKLQELKCAHEEALHKYVTLERRAESLKLVTAEIDRDKLDRLYEEKRILEKKLSVLTRAEKALISAYEKMQRNFTPQINKTAAKYFSKICDGKYSSLYCGEDFSIKIESGIPRESAFFSGGTVDQLYLSLRLALTDMLFGEKTAFMLLDQPFLQYDSLRTVNSVELLESLSENRQILLFTTDRETFSENKITEMLT